jgi:uncharacterized protein (TIGR00255 family)
MTGFGRARREWADHSLTVELRALNNKYLDLNLRLPQVLRMREMELRRLLTPVLKRGKVDLTVTLVAPQGDERQVLNPKAVRDYHAALSPLAADLGHDPKALLPLVLGLPGVTQSVPPEEDPELWEHLQVAVQEACGHLEAFRAREGESLKVDLLQRADSIDALRSQVLEQAPKRLERNRQRMEAALQENSTPEHVDRNRLEQELLYWMDKLDLNEELVRLQHHLTYLREVLDGDATPGKKLGFIGQEIGREINTLGSKANDADIQRLVVRMKDELEKIKEQALNVL